MRQHRQTSLLPSSALSKSEQVSALSPDCCERNDSTAPAGMGLRLSLAQLSAQTGPALTEDQFTQGFIQSGPKNF